MKYHFEKASCPSSDCHYNDVIMGIMASEITSLAIVYSTVYSDADHRKHQSSTSLAFVGGIHWWPVNFLHKWQFPAQMASYAENVSIWWHHHTRLICPSNLIAVQSINTSRPGQHSGQFAHSIIEFIFLYENCCILILITLKYVPKGSIDNKPALIQIMTWYQTGKGPLSEPIRA